MSLLVAPGRGFDHKGLAKRRNKAPFAAGAQVEGAEDRRPLDGVKLGFVEVSEVEFALRGGHGPGLAMGGSVAATGTRRRDRVPAQRREPRAALPLGGLRWRRQRPVLHGQGRAVRGAAVAPGALRARGPGGGERGRLRAGRGRAEVAHHDPASEVRRRAELPHVDRTNKAPFALRSVGAWPMGGGQST